MENNKIKVVNKGYTLTVVSWKNDGDDYNTQSKTVKTIKEAKVWWDMMLLCKDGCNNKISLGNSYDGFSKKQEEIAKDFLKENYKILLPNDNIKENEDDLVDWFCDLASELLGSSENYMCRVMESCVITYSSEDIYLEKIEFLK